MALSDAEWKVLNGIREAVAELAQKVATLTVQMHERHESQLARCRDHEQRLAGVQTDLDGKPGNGNSMGIKRQVDRLSGQVDRLEKSQDDRQTDRRGILVQAISGAVVAAIAALAVHFVK